MIITIRKLISKSFFFINIKPPSYKKLASTQQLVFPYRIILSVNYIGNKIVYIFNNRKITITTLLFGVLKNIINYDIMYIDEGNFIHYKREYLTFCVLSTHPNKWC